MVPEWTMEVAGPGRAACRMHGVAARIIHRCISGAQFIQPGVFARSNSKGRCESAAFHASSRRLSRQHPGLAASPACHVIRRVHAFMRPIGLVAGLEPKRIGLALSDPLVSWCEAIQTFFVVFCATNEPA